MVRFQTVDDSGKHKIYMVIYFQYDGYPEGVGKNLTDFIESKTMVNGYNDKEKQFNGFGCFLAQYIAKFKDGVGNMYVCAPDTVMNEEYNYVVTYNEQTNKFTVDMNLCAENDINDVLTTTNKALNNVNDDDNSEYSECSDHSESCSRNSANYKYWRS